MTGSLTSQEYQPHQRMRPGNTGRKPAACTATGSAGPVRMRICGQRSSGACGEIWGRGAACL